MELKSRTKVGVLLSNLGTPDAPTTQDVAKYLKEFLSDPYVVDIPYLFRWLLVHFIIVPFRSARSAEAYQKIWSHQGSPLLKHSLDLLEGLRHQFTDIEWSLGMRYGRPSIEDGIQELIEKKVDKILFLPLYPQFSYAATESSIAKFNEIIEARYPEIERSVINDFYRSPEYINAYAENIKATQLTEDRYVLFSYHGIPERQIARVSGCDRARFSEQCFEKECPAISDFNANCYRAQCYATTREIAKVLKLKEGSYSTSFQSRLGRTKWIEPYTDKVLSELTEKGVRKLIIVSPSFVADCLETVEELGIRGREQFLQNKGEVFDLVPCLNARKYWIDALNQIIRKKLSHDNSVTQNS